MAIAVSVLLFIIALAFLISAVVHRGRDWISNLNFVTSVAIGVLNIGSGMLAHHLAAGIMLCIYGVASIILFVEARDEATSGGSNDGLAIAVCMGAFKLMAWVHHLRRPQLTIVV